MLAAGTLGRRDLIGRDPIGAALAGISGAPGLDASDGILRSRDGTSILVLATPAGDPFGGADAACSMAELESIAAALGGVASLKRSSRQQRGAVFGQVRSPASLPIWKRPAWQTRARSPTVVQRWRRSAS